MVTSVWYLSVVTGVWRFLVLTASSRGNVWKTVQSQGGGYRCVVFDVRKTVQSQGGGYRCVVFDVRKTVQSQGDVLIWIQVCGV